MKVLIIGYACEPNKGSEPGVGWNTVQKLAIKCPHYTFTVLTRENNREAIEKEISFPNLAFVYHDIPAFFSIKKKFNATRLYYYVWCITCGFDFRDFSKDFDLVHHITFVNDWLPSPICLLKKSKHTKFLWGPLGSNQAIPTSGMSLKSKFLEILRRCIPMIIRGLDPFYYLTKKRSDIILGINERVEKKFSSVSNKFIKLHSISVSKDYAIDKSDLCVDSNKLFTFISVGNLIAIKNFEITILSFNRFLQLSNNSDCNYVLNIVGTGPLLNYLQSLVTKLGIDKNVNFLGQQSYDSVRSLLRDSSAFIFPTMEASGMVILEAMISSLPVLGINTGGAAAFLPDSNKIYLANYPSDKENIVNEIATSMYELAKSPELLKQLGYLNRKHVLNNYTWDSKIDKYIDIYKCLFLSRL